MTVKFKIRRGTAAEWTTANPILLDGEPGLETDTEILKVGDGVNLWGDLPEYLDKDGTTLLIQTAIDGAVLEGVPGDSAYQVAVDNGFVGTEEQWLASLVGPTGATGSAGAKGDKGDTGNTGATGSAGAKGDTGDQGPTGATGATGAKGDDGDSAYQVAVTNGFIGDEAAWLASLHGATGSTGAKGDKGDTGDQGPTGATGSTGATGAKGDPGDLNRITVGLTDQTNITTDCSLGNTFRVTLGGNRTLSNPTNMTDGQRVVWELIQDATGSRTITLGSKFALGTDIATVTLTTTANKRDFLGAIYNSTADKWYVLAFTKGY